MTIRWAWVDPAIQRASERRISLVLFCSLQAGHAIRIELVDWTMMNHDGDAVFGCMHVKNSPALHGTVDDRRVSREPSGNRDRRPKRSSLLCSLPASENHKPPRVEGDRVQLCERIRDTCI